MNSSSSSSSSSSYTIRVLLIMSGDKSSILRSSHIFKDIIKLTEYLFGKLGKGPRIVFCINEENIDIFHIIDWSQFDSVAMIPLRLDTFPLILDEEYQLVVSSDMFRTPVHNTLLKLISSIQSLNGPSLTGFENESFYDLEAKFPLFAEATCLNKYDLVKPSHPIDIVHSIMPLKKSRTDPKPPKIIGINIGEDCDPTLRPPISELVNIIQPIFSNPNNRIVLFGASHLDFRRQMVTRGLKNSPVGNASITSALKLGLDSRLLAQAIPFCDLFISFESFMVDIAAAFGIKTIFLSARNFRNVYDLPHILTSKSKWDYTKCNCVCFKNKACPLLDSDEDSDTCFYYFDIKEISKKIQELLNGD